MGIRQFVRGHRWAVLAIAVVVVTVTSAVLLVLQTMPPRSIAMATGPEGGAYDAIGKRYQASLRERGSSSDSCRRAERCKILRCCATPTQG
jgi:hypothetical protein